LAEFEKYTGTNSSVNAFLQNNLDFFLSHPYRCRQDETRWHIPPAISHQTAISDSAPKQRTSTARACLPVKKSAEARRTENDFWSPHAIQLVSTVLSAPAKDRSQVRHVPLSNLTQ